MNTRLTGVVTAALLATALVPPGGAWGADHPPKGLHFTGDHWTAWNPPPAPPPPAQVHVVAKGDTLWDLAKKYYGNPYLWPQLWEKNQYVLDAHWIYPGDPLALGPQVSAGDNVAGLPSGPAEGEKELPLPEVGGVASANAAAGAPIPLGSESDIYC